MYSSLLFLSPKATLVMNLVRVTLSYAFNIFNILFMGIAIYKQYIIMFVLKVCINSIVPTPRSDVFGVGWV